MTIPRSLSSTARIISTSVLAIALFSFNLLAADSSQNKEYQHKMITSQTFSSINYQADENVKMFPAPNQGMEQHILTLSQLNNEADYMVEIQIGKTQLVDCNKHGLFGALTTLTVKGWGYQYYQVNSIKPGPSTLMACFDKAKTEQFLSIQDKLMLKYDSRLPKVFYLPQGSELRYRVWRVDTEFNTSSYQSH
ncbi:serine protease inhibitor ecotin [Shewanella sp. VB17]|uniref:serine protease inhibitor ecotin n=1 Tax=Shewanella sp. VB17 TaxID=2739432 RepID=UPI0015657C87|nr:serine protease inhibitor ecotin [Shewanella sp. VB17]NRD73732.1 serine protease inhibitor ecotin [Shewanella sp. VB17]